MARSEPSSRAWRPVRAFLDANVLFGQLDTDVLMSIAGQGLMRPFWSADVLDEVRRNILRSRHNVTPKSIDRRIAHMNRAEPDALVSGYRGFESVVQHDTDAKDSHVLAAAVTARCDVIITENTKDFRFQASSWAALEQMKLSQFLTDRIVRTPDRVAEALQVMTERWHEVSSLHVVADRYEERSGFGGLARCLHRLADGDRDFSDVPRTGRIDVPVGSERASAELRLNHARPAFQGIAPPRLQPVSGSSGERPYRPDRGGRHGPGLTHE